MRVCKKNPNLFIKNIDINNTYTTRNKLQLSYTSHKTSLFERSISYAAIKAYNKLPPDIREIDKLKTFQTKTKLFFTNKPLYTVGEYFLNIS